MSKTLRIDFKTKNSNIKNRAAIIKGTIFAKLIENGSEIFIEKVFAKLTAGTEYNTHQQESLSEKSTSFRRKFATKFDFPYNSDKELILISDDQLTWINEHIEEISTIKNIELFLRGNWANGSQENRKRDDIRIATTMYVDFPFLNLLSALKVNSSVMKMEKFEVGEVINFEQLINELVAKRSKTVLPVLQSYFASKEGNFYIDFARNVIFSETEESDINTVRHRNRFKANMMSSYELIDWIYSKFSNSSIVEAAHIKPVSHISIESEIEDINNGLFLPIHLHRLFDNGSITFNDNGKLIYQKRSASSNMGVSDAEITALDLDNISLPNDKIVTKRMEYMKYHRDHIFKKGI